MDSVARWAKLLDWGNGREGDNIIIGYEFESSRLLFQVYNNLVSDMASSVPIVERVILGQWYHFVVVIVPLSATGWEAVATVYVDGVQTASVSDMLLPQYVERRSALLGRSNWVDDALFSAKVDAIRVYDYAITAAQATQLYRLAHDSTFIPTPPAGDPTAAPPTTRSSTGGPTPARSSSAPISPTTPPRNPNSSSSSSSTGTRRPTSPTSSVGGVCEYGLWPNCECRCEWPGYAWPNCRACPGEEPGMPSRGSSVDAGLIIVVVACILVAAAVATGVYVYWKNKRGRVTYSLDGGFSDSNGPDGSEWLPNSKRRGAAGGGLLGDSSSGNGEDSSTYDWQSYRNAAPANRMDMQSWSNQ